MSNETTITIVGNLTADPELRFTQSGQPVANFTIASTPRLFDRNTNEWKDGETLFLRSSIWKEAAENAAESLTKGMRVIASGRLKSRTYDTKEGEKRTVTELEIDEIGPSLRNSVARVTRTDRTGNRGGAPTTQAGYGGYPQQTAGYPQPNQQQAAPWGATQQPQTPPGPGNNQQWNQPAGAPWGQSY